MPFWFLGPIIAGIKAAMAAAKVVAVKVGIGAKAAVGAAKAAKVAAAAKKAALIAKYPKTASAIKTASSAASTAATAYGAYDTAKQLVSPDTTVDGFKETTVYGKRPREEAVENMIDQAVPDKEYNISEKRAQEMDELMAFIPNDGQYTKERKFMVKGLSSNHAKDSPYPLYPNFGNMPDPGPGRENTPYGVFDSSTGQYTGYDADHAAQPKSWFGSTGNYVYDKVAGVMQQIGNAGKRLKRGVIEAGQSIKDEMIKSAKNVASNLKHVVKHESGNVIKGVIKGGVQGLLQNDGTFKGAKESALKGASDAFRTGVGDAVGNIAKNTRADVTDKFLQGSDMVDKHIGNLKGEVDSTVTHFAQQADMLYSSLANKANNILGTDTHGGQIIPTFDSFTQHMHDVYNPMSSTHFAKHSAQMREDMRSAVEQMTGNAMNNDFRAASWAFGGGKNQEELAKMADRMQTLKETFENFTNPQGEGTETVYG